MSQFIRTNAKIVVVVIAQQLFSYHQLSTLRKSVTAKVTQFTWEQLQLACDP